MTQHRTLWIALGAVLLLTFGILGFFGSEVYREAPPISSTAAPDLLAGTATTPWV